MATAIRESGGGDPRPQAAVRSKWTMPMVIAALALVLRVWAPGPVTQTADEFSWLPFSDGFRQAVGHGDFAQATVPPFYTTLPGVTTMWAGTLGHWSVSLGHALGLTNAPMIYAGSVLRASRVVVALWCSIALGLLVAVASLLVGRRAAAIAGVLLATEPFLVGHSDVLHTDAMVTMFGALSIVALLAGLRAGRPAEPAGDATDPTSTVGVPCRARLPLVVLSGASAALAALTKMNAIPLLLGAAAVIITVELVTARRKANGGAGWWKSALRDNAYLLGVWALAGLVVSVAVWPALWVAPLEQVRRMRAAAHELGQLQGTTFFRHRLTRDPGVTFYPVAMLFRMTPWFLVGTVISSFAVLAGSIRGLRRSHRASPLTYVAATLLLASVPYAVVASLTSPKYDRYMLPLYPFLAIACGVVAAQTIGLVESGVRPSRRLLSVGVVVTALLAVSTLSHAPYAISYADPLVGGQNRASRNILLGWGEGLEVLGAEVRHLDGKRCKDARVAGPFTSPVAFPCGHLVSFASVGHDLHKLDYFVTYVTGEQLFRPLYAELFNSVRRHGYLVKSVNIDGFRYGELWRIRRAKLPNQG